MKKSLLTALLCAAVCLVSAAEKELLNWDFAMPNSMDFRGNGESYGNYKIQGDTVIMPAGSRLCTVKFPIRKGETIRVTMDGKADQLKGEDYHVGWCTVTYYNEAGTGIGHQDLMYVQETMDWKSTDAQFVPPGNAVSFDVNLTHSGKSGTAFYRNVHIYTKDNIAEELIADSDFEDILGVNYWFFKRDGKDWDNFPYFAETGKAELDEKDFVTGKKSLALSGNGATIVSQEFPYNGEEFIASGWIKRSDDFQAEGWAGGGVQLVGLDANGKAVGHVDLNLDTKKSGWKYYSYSTTFTPGVKKVQLFVRDFYGAKGTVWIDQLRLRRIPNGVVLPFNGKENTLTIDCAKLPEKEINYRVWAGADALYASWLLREESPQAIPYLKKIGLEMIRFREISNGLNMYPNDNPDGTPHYDFTKWDKLMDLMVQNGFIPNVTLGTTPPALAKPGTDKYGWCNGTAPKDMKKWGKFIEAIFRHSVERYGVKEVNKWYWEIWNEPVVPSERGDYVGSKEEFIAMCEEVYLAGERVEKDTPGLHLMLGMTSGGQAGASDEFIFDRLQKIGKLNLIRHRSRHYYAGISETISMTGARIKEMQEQGARYGCPPYQSGCTEWNLSAMESPYFNTIWCAAFAVKMVKVFLDNGLDYATFFAMFGHPEIPMPDPLYDQGMSLITRMNDYRNGGAGKLEPITKPVYNAFLMMNELRGGKRLNVKQVADPADAIAAIMPDGTIRVVVTNYDEDTARQPYTTKVTLDFTGIDGSKYKCTRNLLCDEEHGNTYGIWKKLGSPTVWDREAPKKIMKDAFPVEMGAVPVRKTENGFSATFDLPSPGLRFLEFKAE